MWKYILLGAICLPLLAFATTALFALFSMLWNEFTKDKVGRQLFLVILVLIIMGAFTGFLMGKATL